jgi:sulfur relay (sulfurtransferase) DsrC/TusE family protein
VIISLTEEENNMAKTALGGIEIEIDEDGFIQEPDKWNKAVAEDLAKRKCLSHE